ncbi:MAG: hypothetical protein KA146_02405 [Leptospiraceae bacterium]|nr:hypothetical protein [Leptospiraceae bacterium]
MIRLRIFISLLIILVLNGCSTYRSFRNDKDTLWKPQSRIKENAFLNTVGNDCYLLGGDTNYSSIVLPEQEKVNLILIQSMREVNLFEKTSYTDDSSAKLQVTGTIKNNRPNILFVLLNVYISTMTLNIIPIIWREQQQLEIKVYENKKEIFSSKKEETLMYYDSVWIDLFSNSKKAGDVQKRVMQEHTSQILKEFYDSYKSSPNFK